MNWNGHAHNGWVMQQAAANASTGHMSALTGSGLPYGQRVIRRHAASLRRSPGPSGTVPPIHLSLPEPWGRRAHTRASMCANIGRIMPGRENTVNGTANSQDSTMTAGIGSAGSACMRERERERVVRRELIPDAYA